MLACTYYGSLSDSPVTEYLPVLHEGYAGQRAMQTLFNLASASGAQLSDVAYMNGPDGLDYLAEQMSKSRHPEMVEYKMDGKFHRVLKRSWTDELARS